MNDDRRFAVLIDADNVSDKYVKYIFDELSTEGIITYKRIYGDWTKPSFSSWKNVLLNYSITPIQQYAYTTGKNATDSAMIIDAMDILYTKSVEGYCIVSSDSDFTRLASRLREGGMFIIGMGEKKTPPAFISACNQFKYLDVLAQMDKIEKEEKQKAPVKQAAKETATAQTKDDSASSKDELTTAEHRFDSIDDVAREISAIAADTSDDEGWSSLGEIGNILIKRYPDFDVRNYKFSKLSKLVVSLSTFEIRSVKNKTASQIYIREKSSK